MQQIQIPPLHEGEVYLTGFINANGDLTHVILLPGDTRTTWPKALEWAKSIGGDLPTRAEQAVAYAKCRDQFQQAAYWSNEPDGSGWAWGQYFSSGGQTSGNHTYELRARAVRRLTV
ncbi:DUF1566 domain-containing protein [Ralstonia insidiosa]|uniref:DUF1566 domain-containing protein n=1 Tax=Ralstonia insidiosa TaxID=190721 RepID=A0A848NWD8_9RALS|nr:DUF1566 domain-containing protein [Ralstonia insidiosa]NMV36806.1 DUF1566 domain-containing protein [Ralstonia insidiosa]